MIVRKFQASTEQEALLLAKQEMGPDVTIMTKKTVKHRALARLFKHDYVEIYAAIEEDTKPKTTEIPKIDLINRQSSNAAPKPSNPDVIKEEPKNSKALEEKINNLQAMVESQIKKSTEEGEEPKKDASSIHLDVLKLLYNGLLDNEVDERYANKIISEVQPAIKKESNVDSILSAVYQKIILKLDTPRLIENKKDKCQIIFFVGPTGVGKTTTIAKLASYFKVNQKAKVGLITSDTYRIAAVEQLRTYANILDVPMQVVYTVEEFNQAVKDLESCDYIFVDTAGRSHKNDEQCQEMIHLINDCNINPERCVKEIYLVLSVATKYKDLLRICDVFSKVGDYSLIFTKLDETMCLGNILNIKMYTNAPLSYITSGQAVPDDISELDAQKIAKALLSGKE